MSNLKRQGSQALFCAKREIILKNREEVAKNIKIIILKNKTGN
jgi:hypothetical protein